MVESRTVLYKEVDKFLKDFKKISNQNSYLKTHQFLAKEYFFNITRRGILIYHEMGSGKSVIASSIINSYNPGKQRKVIVLTPGSLVEVIKNGVNSQNGVHYVSLNSYNAFEKLKEIDVFNSLLIVDEAHNLFTSIVNGSRNGTQIYNYLMDKKKVKIIFMTGTPIVNTSFEICPCFNMLAGKKILPESKDDFERFFLKENNDGILMNRLYGLVSYYNKKLTEGGSKLKKNINIIRVQFSKEHLEAYREARQNELRQKKINKQREQIGVVSSSKASSSYNVASRQISNAYTAKNLSPKMDRIMSILKEEKNKLHIIYSQFVRGPGLEFISDRLSQEGYSEWDGEDEKGLRYSVIVGDTPKVVRVSIMDKFNTKENKNGNIIQVVLISPAGVEGLSFKNIRFIHVFEPYWNFSRIEQIIYRGDRMNSHEDLKENERTLTTNMYITTHNENFEKKSIEEDILEMALEKRKKNKKILNVLKYIAFDCPFYNKDCYFCESKRDLPLYRNDLFKDIKEKYQPCENYKEKEAENKDERVFEEYVIGNNFYYLDTQHNEVFFYDSISDSYIPLSEKNPIFKKIMSK